MRTVYVHATEYVNEGPQAGGGGFFWYAELSDAQEARDNAEVGDDLADFLFEVQVEATDPDGVTTEIDGQLHDLTAKAANRRVGANVLKYWNENDFNMGTATEAAS